MSIIDYLTAFQIITIQCYPTFPIYLHIFQYWMIFWTFHGNQVNVTSQLPTKAGFHLMWIDSKFMTLSGKGKSSSDFQMMANRNSSFQHVIIFCFIILQLDRGSIKTLLRNYWDGGNAGQNNIKKMFNRIQHNLHQLFLYLFKN